MADPTPAEVQAALAILAAAEAAREAANTIVMKPVPATSHVAPAVSTPVSPAAATATSAPVPVVAITGSPPAVAPTAPASTAPASIMPTATTAVLDADVSTYLDIVTSLRSFRSTLLGVSEHEARQAYNAHYSKLIDTARKQNLIP
jgi:hypothetical protein